MAKLPSLPTELIIQIYTYSATLRDAACLGSANKRLRSVWLENTNPIAEVILKPQFLLRSYDSAVDLAILEEAAVHDVQYPQTMTEFPIRLYLHRLLRNASLAASAVNAWVAHMDATDYTNEEDFGPAHASYYLMRKILFAHQHPDPELHQAIFLTLQASSKGVLTMLDELACFLLSSFADDDERLRHGIPKAREDWTEEDEMEHEMGSSINVEQWEYVGDVLDVAMRDRFHGRNTLKEVIINGKQERN